MSRSRKITFVDYGAVLHCYIEQTLMICLVDFPQAYMHKFG